MPDASQWVSVCSTSEFVGERLVKGLAEGIDVLLCRSGGDIVAMHNYCTHLGQPLERGRIIGGQIYCPFHGACFDLKSGKAVSGPAISALHLFPVRIEDGQIQIDVRHKPRYSLIRSI
jgi:nitrite reductase/ring-hydroxylating ferredoxin subunit